MKKIKLLCGILLIGLLSSCGGGNKTSSKEIEPTTTEFRSGELAKYIEVVDEASELSYAEVDGAVGTQYIRLKVTLKMLKDGFKDVDPRDLAFTSLLSVACVDLVDANGSRVQDLSIKDDDILKLKKLLTKEAGATEVIVFEGEFHNSEDAPKWFEETVKFTPTLTADVEVRNSEASTSTDTEEETSTDDNSIETPASTTTSVSTSSSSSSSSDENFDEFLAAYEKYINSYIALMKKANDGDVTAVAEAASMMAEAQEYSDKLQKLSGDLTPAQLAKFQKLQQKLLNAAK